MSLPTLSCQEESRVGKLGDGGKWVFALNESAWKRETGKGVLDLLVWIKQ
jgi:hypothetical protein